MVGVACDSTNTLMISAGYHGDIKVCMFLVVPSPVARYLLKYIIYNTADFFYSVQSYLENPGLQFCS